MPKIVDHAARRDEIALVACRVVATHGFERATVVKIAREAGYTTGMIAHYFDSKQEIILAALRLILRRIDDRLAHPTSTNAGLLDVLAEALPLDAQRATECAFWTAFWGQVSADRRLRRINAWVHREYLRLFERCLAEHWSEWASWPAFVRNQVLRSVMTFINGLTASAVVSPGEWPPARQLAQLGLQLDLWRGWAVTIASGDRGGGVADRAGSGASGEQAAPKPGRKAARARATRASAG
jgi:TetR/AcrR family transcriptional repressor of bet genes